MFDLDPKKEYCLRSNLAEKGQPDNWKSLVIVKLHNGKPSISFAPELGRVLASGKWVNTSLSIYDKKDQTANSTQPAKTGSYGFDDEAPF